MADPRPVQWFRYDVFALALRESGFTQRSLAERLGVTQTTVSRWANGRRQPTREQAVQLETLLGHDLIRSEYR
jgi:transcriptional regulator with XRE-family HTH domain